MSQTQFVKLACVAVASVFGYFVLGPDGSQQMHQLLLAGTVLFTGLAVVL